MKYKVVFGLSILSAGWLLGGPAAAAPAQDAIEACRVAVEASTDGDVVAKLTRIKARGVNYEVWMNVSGAAGEEQRSYCYLRRGEVDQFVLEDGKWIGRNPRRPESVKLG